MLWLEMCLFGKLIFFNFHGLKFCTILLCAYENFIYIKITHGKFPALLSRSNLEQNNNIGISWWMCI